jgi:hypothetical protein
MARIGILLSVNPKAAPTLEKNPYNGMDQREANIEQNKEFSVQHRAVYWDTNFPGHKKINRDIFTFPTFCYFYESTRRGITYKAVLERVLYREELLLNQQEQRFVPEWRIQCLTGSYRGEKHEPSLNWLKVKKFERVIPFSPRELEKQDGSPCRGLRFAYVKELY